MGRGRRICYAGAFFHCINRGHRRERLFLEDDDYREFLKGMAEAGAKYRVRVHGDCLLGNHWHLLMQQQELSDSSVRRQACRLKRCVFGGKAGGNGRKCGHS
jgi:putative transposase